MIPAPSSSQAQPQYSEAQIAAEQAEFLRKVYAFMAGGLALTALTAWLVAHSQAAVELIVGNRIIFYGLLISELLMVGFFSRLVRNMTASGAASLFFLYAIVNGLTLSVIFLVYTTASITTTFMVTAGTFGRMSIYGFLTKRDLSGVGHFAVMGLWGLILASVVNVFMNNDTIYWLTTFMGVIVFVGLAAYDTQKIKELNVIGNAGTDEDHKEAIHGALVLYLDFVNLFLYLLRLLGRRR
jgi:uncharacterized protein